MDCFSNTSLHPVPCSSDRQNDAKFGQNLRIMTKFYIPVQLGPKRVQISLEGASERGLGSYGTRDATKPHSLVRLALEGPDRSVKTKTDSLEEPK